MEEVEVKTTMGAREFAELLHRCADALDAGKQMDLVINGRTLTLRPEGKYKVKYELEHGEHELEFEMTWHEAA